MKLPVPILLALTFRICGCALFAGESTAAFGDKNFTFPDDYILELAAGQPMIERPMEASFDERGRLYVTESSGSRESVEMQLAKKPHRVLRLEDTDGDGVFDKRTVFAEGLMFPEGCLWHDGALFVAAPPQIWKLTDADDDGVAEKREVWFDGKTLTGCANDLHGPYLGPDGWIYWCKGAFAEQTYDLPGQPGWKTRAAHVFRARPDGSAVEPVFTAGMDNPVGLAWTPEGEMIVSGTFFQEPAEGHRDGLIHGVYGGVWGKAHDVLAGHPRTGALMPPMTHLGPAAPAGVTRYGRDLLVAQFNLRTVSRHRLVSAGASYRTEDSALLVCDHPDFHPTDVLQAPDGSVLILDTGGWYKLCCPTSQLAKETVPGGIYQLRKKGGEVPVGSPPPEWSIGDPGDTALQVRNLRAADPHVRRRAAEALGRARAGDAVPDLLSALAAPDLDRFLFHAITYALLQIADAARTRLGLSDSSPSVQAGALYALDQMPRGNVTALEVAPLLASADPRLQEAAAFVAARHRSWAGELLPWFDERLRAVTGPDAILRNVLRAFVEEAAIQKWIGAELAKSAPGPQQAFLLQIMAERRSRELPGEWCAPVAQLLTTGSADSIAEVLAVLAAAPPPPAAGIDALLRRIAADAQKPGALRLGALARCTTLELNDAEFRFVLAQLPAGEPAAAPLLAKAALTREQRLQLAPMIGNAGILERPQLLKAFAGNRDAEVGRALLRSVSAPGVLAGLSRDSLAEAFAVAPAEVRQELAAAQLASTPPDQRARIDELERSLGKGDAHRGAIVFQSTKSSCISCHPAGYVGGHLGPDLSKVGAVRTRRDLIEAIVFPSASFVRSYETVQAKRWDGTAVFGIVTNQSDDALTLATAPNTPPTTIPRREIGSLTPAEFSLMPQGFDRSLTPQELADLVAYLESRR